MLGVRDARFADLIERCSQCWQETSQIEILCERWTRACTTHTN